MERQSKHCSPTTARVTLSSAASVLRWWRHATRNSPPGALRFISETKSPLSFPSAEASGVSVASSIHYDLFALVRDPTQQATRARHGRETIETALATFDVRVHSVSRGL